MVDCALNGTVTSGCSIPQCAHQGPNLHQLEGAEKPVGLMMMLVRVRVRATVCACVGEPQLTGNSGESGPEREGAPGGGRVVWTVP